MDYEESNIMSSQLHIKVKYRLGRAGRNISSNALQLIISGFMESCYGLSQPINNTFKVMDAASKPKNNTFDHLV